MIVAFHSDSERQMDPKKKNMILIGVVVLLLIGAIGLGFRDTIFGGPPPATSAEVQDAINQSATVVDPVPTEPPRSSFTKAPKKLGN